MKSIAVAAGLLFVPALALADDKVDCANPQVQIEMNYCAEQDYLAADKQLNDAYKQAMAAMKNIDSYLEPDQRDAADALKKAQREWIPFRDDACQAEGYMVSGGSMMSMIIYQCLERLTRQRISDLDILIKGMGN
jgi:uncharacterized protein YecT (DUF1311 family)